MGDDDDDDVYDDDDDDDEDDNDDVASINRSLALYRATSSLWNFSGRISSSRGKGGGGVNWAHHVRRVLTWALRGEGSSVCWRVPGLENNT